MTTQIAWLREVYPKAVECGFCKATLTIRLVAKKATTYTTGHAPSCPMVEKPRRSSGEE